MAVNVQIMTTPKQHRRHPPNWDKILWAPKKKNPFRCFTAFSHGSVESEENFNDDPVVELFKAANYSSHPHQIEEGIQSSSLTQTENESLVSDDHCIEDENTTTTFESTIQVSTPTTPQKRSTQSPSMSQRNSKARKGAGRDPNETWSNSYVRTSEMDSFTSTLDYLDACIGIPPSRTVTSQTSDGGSSQADTNEF